MMKFLLVVFAILICGLCFAQDDPLFEVKDGDATIFSVTPNGITIMGMKLETVVEENKLELYDANDNRLFYASPENARFIFHEPAELSDVDRGGFAISTVASGSEDDGINLLDLTEDNYFIGHEAGAAITSGTYNQFIGYQAGMLTTYGSDNMFLGYWAGKSNIDGYSNVFIGPQSGMSNTSGNRNIFIGEDCGLNNSTGLGNLFMGWQAGKTNTGGSNNIFIGPNSGKDNTTGGSNTFVGVASGYQNTTGANNTFLGSGAGNSNTEADWNTFMGNGCGQNTTGGFNTFIGGWTGLFHTSSSDNTFIGTQAGLGGYTPGATGSSNVYVGKASGGSQTSGSNNVYLGSSAGGYKTSGNNNVFVGYKSGLSNGDSGGNVFIGNNAGQNETNSNKLYIANSSTTTPLIYGDFSAGSQEVVINGNSTTNSDNRRFFVNGTAGGTTSWYNDSDARQKENINPIQQALEKVCNLEGVTFEWQDKSNHPKGDQLGFIAQDVEDILPEVVDNSGDHYSMQYAPITALLVEAIKQQQDLIEEMNMKISEMEKQLESNQ